MTKSILVNTCLLILLMVTCFFAYTHYKKEKETYKVLNDYYIKYNVDELLSKELNKPSMYSKTIEYRNDCLGFLFDYDNYKKLKIFRKLTTACTKVNSLVILKKGTVLVCKTDRVPAVELVVNFKINDPLRASIFNPLNSSRYQVVEGMLVNQNNCHITGMINGKPCFYTQNKDLLVACQE